jgi:hypothetical protein
MVALKPLPPPPGLRCPSCDGSEFELGPDAAGRVRLACTACGVFARLLRRHGDPAPEFAPPVEGESEYSQDEPLPGSWWLAYVRPRGGGWRPVALAESLGEAWEAVLTGPVAGSYLLAPTDPPRRGESPEKGYSMSADTIAWVGWHRPHGKAPWKALVRAADEDACWRQLLDTATGGDKLVQREGRDPNERPEQWGAR